DHPVDKDEDVAVPTADIVDGEAIASDDDAHKDTPYSSPRRLSLTRCLVLSADRITRSLARPALSGREPPLMIETRLTHHGFCDCIICFREYLPERPVPRACRRGDCWSNPGVNHA